MAVYYRHKEGEKTLDGKPSFFAGERYRKVKYEVHHLWDRVRHEFCTHGASWIGRQCFSSQRQIDGSRGNRIERNSAEVAPACRWNKRGLMLFIWAYRGKPKPFRPIFCKNGLISRQISALSWQLHQIWIKGLTFRISTPIIRHNKEITANL